MAVSLELPVKVNGLCGFSSALEAVCLSAGQLTDSGGHGKTAGLIFGSVTCLCLQVHLCQSLQQAAVTRPLAGYPMPGNDAELGFAVLLEHGHVDRAVLASGALGRGHHVLALQALDEVDTEGRSWLDANAPGWCVDVAVLPFGSRRDGSAREVQPFYNAWLVLAERTHREAWQARLLEEQIQRQAVAVRIARAQAENPDAVFCAHCGNIMTAYQRRQMSRQAQFGFSFLARGYECRECGCSQLPPDDKDAIEREAARIKARSQVGLPWRGRSQTDATKAEWRRREKSPPEAAVECLPGMSCADIIAELQRLSDRADSARHPNLHLLGGPD